VNIVAYSLKAIIMVSQQPVVTRQRRVNNREIVFSAQSVPMAAHVTMEYVTHELRCNKGTAFSTRSVPRCSKQDQLTVAVNPAWWRLLIPPP
jgi:hypothetical protein